MVLDFQNSEIHSVEHAFRIAEPCIVRNEYVVSGDKKVSRSNMPSVMETVFLDPQVCLVAVVLPVEQYCLVRLVGERFAVPFAEQGNDPVMIRPGERTVGIIVGQAVEKSRIYA